MNLYALIAIGVFWVASVTSAGWFAYRAGVDSEVAGQVKISKAIADTKEAAQQGAAAAISKIEVKNVTINRKLETEVREKRIFADCRSGPDSVRLYNSGIPGYAESPGDGVVPAAPAPAR